ncbi:uncharacterized protein LTHEOB_12433 [Lasiodiplodia theobromae]|uniref:uncharacterized protein n=1 Tax=Lasiodiplodia theobromae TaxID=45133 RepID=UPI0015C3F976|nr:uncharacterized protein LTHEOB_12433 [Lasiodiplodia theobromae]KAF4535907.1 hypothetical protein LTHEOB_12433 [Lasiodiplodia theobromae]
MHRYESFGGLSDGELDEDLDTTYLPPSPSPGPRVRPRAVMDGEDYVDLSLDDNEAASETSVYASLDDEEETSDAVFEEANEQAEAQEAEAEENPLHARRRRVHFSSGNSSISPPPPQTRPPRPAASPAPAPPSSPPPMPPPPRPATQPIHITLSRCPTMTAGQPPLHIRINTIRRRLLPSSHPDSRAAGIRAARTALATTRQRLVAIFTSFGMRDRDSIVDWDAIDAALTTKAIDDGNAPPPPIDEATQREVDGWLTRRMGSYTGRGVTEVYPEEYYDDDYGDRDSGEAAAAAAAEGRRPQRQGQGRKNCMIKGCCEMRVVFASKMQMQAVVRAIEAEGAMGDGVRSMATVLRFWNEEWRVENPDLAIEADDLGVGDMLRLNAIRPLDKVWEE